MSQISFGYQNPIKARLGEEFFTKLPNEAGIYVFLDERRKPLYIGKADSLKKRLASYKNAKPGTVGEHILEMIEHARDIVWERHPDGARALTREAELIRAIRPPFNIAGTEAIPFLSIGVKHEKPVARGEWAPVQFRLSHQELPSGFSRYGCYLHRGKTKAGYSALLRLFHATGQRRGRFSWPAGLCRTSPAYVHATRLPATWLPDLDRFLKGESSELLRTILDELLRREDLHAYLYAPLQRDLVTAREFFRCGPESTRQLIKQSGLKKTSLSQTEARRFAARLENARLTELTKESVI